MKDDSKEVQNEKSILVLDEKDEAILHCIAENPEILVKQIPDKLKERDPSAESISYPTVLRRINRLTENKVINRDFSINWAKAGYLVRYRVGILIDPIVLSNVAYKKYNSYDSQAGLADYIMQELPKQDAFKDKLIIEDVHILLGGQVDMSVDFYAKDDKIATRFIIDALRKLPGISNTASAKLAYSSKYKWLSKNGD